jgi:modulator of FtsH protease HflC
VTGPRVLAPLAVVAVLLALSSIYTVSETEQVIRTQFGRPVGGVVNRPGLHVKLPLIQDVHRFDKRWLEYDGDANEIPTRDKKYIWVDTYARWRITDPLRFYQAVNNIPNANQRLSSITNSSMRNVLARASRDPIVRTERANLMNRIQEDVNRQAQNLGIEIIDLRLTRVDLPAANSQAVYQRMQTERQREAADLRGQGSQAAQGIRARADRERVVIVAEATRQSEELRGTGDAEKNRILAEAYGKDADFFAFYRSMQAYETGLRPGDTRLVLSPTSQFFRYFNDAMGRGNTPAPGSRTPDPAATSSNAPPR